MAEEKNIGGRPQSVSKNINENELVSTVKPFTCGGYIPVPKKYVGKKVKVIILEEKARLKKELKKRIDGFQRGVKKSNHDIIDEVFKDDGRRN